MVADRRIVGWVLLVLGAAVALPQVFVRVPSQFAFAGGLLAMSVGGLLLCDGGGEC